MGRPSLAVVVACATVGTLVFIFLLVRITLFIRHRNNSPVPLPPPRPLTAFSTLPWNANHSTTNLNSRKLDFSSPISLSPTSYQSEFLLARQKHAGERSRNLYRQYSGSSFNTDEVPLRQPPSPIARASSPLTDAFLVPPQPSYIAATVPGTSSNRSSAQLSLYSSTEESDIASYPLQRHQSVTSFPPVDPLTADSPPSESPAGSPYPNNAFPRPSGGPSRRQSLTGSVSTTQTGRSARSTRTHSAIRGPPHKPHNRIEIVLPAPLAPENRANPSYLLQLHERDMTYGGNSRQSVVDPWLRVGRDNIGPSNTPSREMERRHRTASSESRAHPRSRQSRLPSSSSLSSLTARTPNQTLGSSRSSFSSAHSHTGRVSLQNEGGLDTSDLPPVPRVPSIYANGSGSSSSPSPSPSTPVLTLSESITGLGKIANGHKANSAPRSPSTPVLALSGSITGTGNFSGLGADTAIKNTARPSDAEPRQPTASGPVEDKAPLPP